MNFVFQVFLNNQEELIAQSKNDESILKNKVTQERNIPFINSQRNDNQDANSIARKTLRLSNVVEGNDIFLHDVLNSAQPQICISDNVSCGNNTFKSSTSPQAANPSSEPTLSFECNNDGFITPCSNNSLPWESSTRKHPQLGLSDT